MSGNLLVVNADGPETRVALIENGLLAELYLERKRERGIVVNIYKGRVVRVLPGMQAAFVDIGVEKAAFLYVADVRGSEKDIKAMFLGAPAQEQSSQAGSRPRGGSDRWIWRLRAFERCAHDAGPGTETCPPNGVDDDCNGIVDDQ